MEKSDRSIHNICLVAIKRCTIQPYDFKWTRFYEQNEDLFLDIELSGNELLICSTIIDKDNFSVLTTQKLTTKKEGILLSSDLINATHIRNVDLKEFKSKPLTSGLVQLSDGQQLSYFVETSRAAMVMAHGMKTIFEVQQMTGAQMEKLIYVWARRDRRYHL
jgi:hypothetical protein